MRQRALATGLLVGTVWSAGCSDDGASGAESPSDASSTGGSADGSQASGGSAATESPQGSGGSEATAGSASTAGAAGAVTFPEQGVCAHRGESTVDSSQFEGYEEYYLIGEDGFGEDLCVVRFDVTRVGAAPSGCANPTTDEACLWTHLVEFSNPIVVTDVDGVCANSELGFDAARIAEINGSQAAYGFASEYAGHNSVLMKYDPAASSWDAYGQATWDETASAFGFDRRDGWCGY